MKQLIARLMLNVAIWAFNWFYDWIDTNDDGNISRRELMEKAAYLDKKSKQIHAKLKKKLKK